MTKYITRVCALLIPAAFASCGGATEALTVGAQTSAYFIAYGIGFGLIPALIVARFLR